MSHNNEVFATDYGNWCVHVFAPDGRHVRTWGSYGDDTGRFKTPYGIAVTKEGEVVVTDSGDDRVKVFRLDGTFLRMWGLRGDGAGQFQYPQSVAVTPSGSEVMVIEGANWLRSNNRVQVFRLSDGAFVRQWGASNPTAVCIATTGEVCVCARKKGIDSCRWWSQNASTTACKCFAVTASSCASGVRTAPVPVSSTVHVV